MKIEFDSDAQVVREQAVASFLDLSNKQWRVWLEKTPDSEIPRELHSYIVTIITALEDGRSVEAARAYVQALSSLATPTIQGMIKAVLAEQESN